MARAIVFTANNYGPETEELLGARFVDGVFSYLIYGREVAPSTGTPHLQGYAELEKQTRIGTIRKLLPKMHVERAKGSAKQNKAYCSKSEDVVEMGEARQQGKRSDLEGVMRDIDAGASLEDIRKKYPSDYIRYKKSITEVHKEVNMTNVKAKFKLEDYRWDPLSLDKSAVIWGPPGLGKTQFALAHFKCPLWVTTMDSLGKFDPAKHDGIVFDDMNFRKESRERQIAIAEHEDDRHIAIRYTDAYIPGGTRKVFTTNERDGAVFDLSDPALTRRVSTFEVKEDGRR